jgi:hypothetical protein
MGGPGSCGKQEARAAGQVVHPHDSAKWAEDMLEHVQDSQQAGRSKITHKDAIQPGQKCKREHHMNLIDEKGEEVSIFG